MNYIHHINKWYWGTTETIVAEDGKSIIKISIDEDCPDSALISGLSVHETVRNQNRGNEILKEAEETIRKNKNIFSINITAEIPWIVEWYKRNNYNSLAIKHDNDVVWLQKKINRKET